MNMINFQEYVIFQSSHGHVMFSSLKYFCLIFCTAIFLEMKLKNSSIIAVTYSHWCILQNIDITHTYLFWNEYLVNLWKGDCKHTVSDYGVLNMNDSTVYLVILFRMWHNHNTKYNCISSRRGERVEENMSPSIMGLTVFWRHPSVEETQMLSYDTNIAWIDRLDESKSLSFPCDTIICVYGSERE